MSLNLNHVTLAGHLTRDPELRQVSPDRAVASFGLAVNRRWKNASGESVEEATFIDVEAWGRTGELVGQYLRKGSAAYLEGRLRLDAWEDKEGQKRSRMKVVAESVQFLGGRPERDGGDQPETEATANAGPGAARPSAARRPAPVRTAAGEEAPF